MKNLEKQGVCIQIGLHHTCEYAYLAEPNWKDLVEKQPLLCRIPQAFIDTYDSWRVIGVDASSESVETLSQNYPDVEFFEGRLETGTDLRDLISDLKIDRLDVLAIDIEGSEFDVLESYDFAVIPSYINVECHRWHHDENEPVEWYARKRLDHRLFSYNYKNSRVMPTNTEFEYPTATLEYIQGDVKVRPASNKFRIHFVGLPHTITSEDFNACAFTGKILRACDWFTRNGHETIHYGYPGARVNCTKHVDITDADFFKKHNRDYSKPSSHSGFYQTFPDAEWTNTFHMELIAKLRQNYKPDDIVFLNYGTFNAAYLPELAKLNVIPIEMSVGYLNSSAPYKIFETHAIQNMQKGIWHQAFDMIASSQPELTMDQMPAGAIHYTQPQWTDDVIYPFLDPDHFECSDKHKDYHLYLGRIVNTKGIELACRATAAIGEPLLIAGQGDFEQGVGIPLPSHATLVGHADIEKRKYLMSNAKAIWCPTWYVEPCGHIFIEAALSGKPSIGTDWGGPAKLILNEKTGYIVRSLGEAIYAAKNVDKIKSEDCRKWGMNFTPDQQMPRYVKYIERIMAARAGQDPLYFDHDVDDLSHRSLIHPDDPNYDIDLNRVQ